MVSGWDYNLRLRLVQGPLAHGYDINIWVATRRVATTSIVRKALHLRHWKWLDRDGCARGTHAQDARHICELIRVGITPSVRLICSPRGSLMAAGTILTTGQREKYWKYYFGNTPIFGPPALVGKKTSILPYGGVMITCFTTTVDVYSPRATKEKSSSHYALPPPASQPLLPRPLQSSPLAKQSLPPRPFFGTPRLQAQLPC
mmetsp:Transcript_14788/g.45148  ORF Transcript_14788/g.45148 Transcript_14788/m.45148 type:complete len:202 (+) Transcript_14788:81-686(+)|eukprot:scaffold141681_cov33-Tisochrysis_lutea.AAC.1